MPSLLITLIINLAIRFGVPLLEQAFPKLAPILEELLQVTKGVDPSPKLTLAAQTYHSPIVA